MSFVVRQNNFEGPLDLLLQLVEKRKLFINDISLASVTDEYLSHIQNLEVDIDQKTEFLSIAAVLILLKSRSLLPNLELTEDENKDVKDLEKRLEVYKFFVDTADALKIFIKNSIELCLPKKRKIQKKISFVEDEKLNINSIKEELFNIMQRQTPKESLPKVNIQKVLTIEEVIDSLHKRIQNSGSFMFSSLNEKVNTKEARVNIIVSFLAMLELVRQGILSVTQSQLFEDISIEKNEQDNSKIF